MEQKNAPLTIAQNKNVIEFADFDDATAVFAKMPATEDVRAQLDDIFQSAGMEFVGAQLPSLVDFEVADEADMVFMYEQPA